MTTKNNNLHFENIVVTLCQFYFKWTRFWKKHNYVYKFKRFVSKIHQKLLRLEKRDLLQVIFLYSLNFFSLEFHLSLFYLFWCLLFFCSYSWSYWRNFSCYFFCLVNLVTFLFVFLLKKNHRNFCFSIFSSKRKKEKKQWIFFSHFFSWYQAASCVLTIFFFFVCFLFGLL